MDNEANTTGYYITTPNGDRYYQPPLDLDTTHGPERARVYCFGAPNQKPPYFWHTKADVVAPVAWLSYRSCRRRTGPPPRARDYILKH